MKHVVKFLATIYSQALDEESVMDWYLLKLFMNKKKQAWKIYEYILKSGFTCSKAPEAFLHPF